MDVPVTMIEAYLSMCLSATTKVDQCHNDEVQHEKGNLFWLILPAFFINLIINYLLFAPSHLHHHGVCNITIEEYMRAFFFRKRYGMIPEVSREGVKIQGAQPPRHIVRHIKNIRYTQIFLSGKTYHKYIPGTVHGGNLIAKFFHLLHKGAKLTCGPW